MKLGVLELLVAAVGVVCTTWVATRELALRRQMDSIAKFLDIIAMVDGRPLDGRASVGNVEQIAGIPVLAALGRQHPWLYESAEAALKEFSKRSGGMELPEQTANQKIAEQAIQSLSYLRKRPRFLGVRSL